MSDGDDVIVLGRRMDPTHRIDQYHVAAYRMTPAERALTAQATKDEMMLHALARYVFVPNATSLEDLARIGGLDALAAALGAIGAAWRAIEHEHEEAVATTAGPVPIDDAVSPEMRTIVERMTHPTPAERWALVEPTAGVMDEATYRVRVVPGLLTEVPALGGVALRLRALQRDGALVTSYLMPSAVARWTYVDEATARGVATGSWAVPCAAYEPRLNGARDECARCPFLGTEHAAGGGRGDREGGRRS